MDSTAYRIPIVLSEDGLSHIPLATGQQLAPWSVPVGTEGDYINPADLISKEPNNPLVLDAAGKLKVDMSKIINPSDTVLFIQNNLVSTQLGMELDNSQLILTGVNNTPIASVSLPIVPGLPIVAEFLHDFTPAPSDNVSGGYETGTYLHLRFAMSNGETKDIYVNYNSLDVEDYKVSYGLTLDNHIIGLKLAPDSGLSVTSQGLSVSGAYSAGNGVAISPQRAISVRAGTGLTFNSGELQALPYTAGNGVSITNRVVAIRLAGNGGLMLADGELAVKLSPNGYLVKTDSGLGVSDALLDMIDSAGDDAMARANEAYDLADGLSAQITGAYEVAEDAANSAALAQTQAATAIEVANNKVDRSGDTMTGDLNFTVGNVVKWEEAAAGRGYMTAGVGGLKYYENISNYSLPNNLNVNLVTAFDTFSNSVFMKLQFIIRTTKNNFFGFGIGTNYYLGLIKNSNTGDVSTYVQNPPDNSSDNSIASTYWTNKVISGKVENLGFNSSNILALENGGTGRTDGASQDVVVAGTSGSILAKSVGQIGQAKVYGTSTDFNTVVERGLYVLTTQVGVANNLPEDASNNVTFMEVFHQGNHVVQRWELVHRIWQRRSVDKGENWKPWYPTSGFRGNLIIHISKSGSDSNTGFSSAYPVLTFARAFQIADMLARGNNGIGVYFRVGAGEWGDLLVSDKPYFITIQPYDGQTPTAYSTSLPVFDNLQSYNSRITVTGLVIGYLRAYDGGKIVVNNGYKRIAWIQAVNNGFIEFVDDSADTNILEINNNGNASYNRGGFVTTSSGMISISNLKIKLTSNLSYIAFIHIGSNGYVYWNPSISVTVSGGSLTGKKYQINAGGSLSTGDTVGKPAFLDTLPGTQAGTDCAGSIYNGIPKGLLGAVAS